VKQNHRATLRYLIPLKLLVNTFPDTQVEQDPKLIEYTELISAVRYANLKQFNMVIEKYQRKWLKRGLFFVIEKLRLLVYRNLFKHVYLFQ
jgi:nuclear mRNA export protein PCID2/THP1